MDKVIFMEDHEIEDEREADLQAAQSYIELAEDPIADNMPGRKQWYLDQANRLMKE
jgi:predicted ABC-class ATPase